MSEKETVSALLHKKGLRTYHFLKNRGTAFIYKNKIPQTLVAITGTNGKTSIVYYMYQIWKACGIKGASIGTIGVQSESFQKEGTLTTPSTAELYQDLNALFKNGITHAALEASSHGLYQDRLHGLKFKAVGFTNLTQDHLDYHKTMDEYLKAKCLLFKNYTTKESVAVLNADIPVFDKIKKVCKEQGLQVFSYGKKGKELKLIKQTHHDFGQVLELELFGKPLSIDVGLTGDFQAMNLLCAIGMAVGSGLKKEDVILSLESLSCPPGRLELVGCTKNGARILIDYAHTPDALENILKTLRPLTEKRLCVVFGCGGNRDTTKRPLMGKIANDLADYAIVTDDNPRFEEAAPIRKAIMAACPKGTEIGDRKKAIETAILELKKGDLLVIAGKGHEEGQKIKGKVIPFNDKTIVTDFLKEISSKTKSIPKKSPSKTKAKTKVETKVKTKSKPKKTLSKKKDTKSK